MSKIALMGYSAGGHLALLYAYKNPNQIDLVISEAGPTDFTGEDFQALPLNIKEPVMLLVNGQTSLLAEESPITYANSDSPYTILAYGGHLGEDGEMNENSTDGIIAYSQATKVVEKLGENKCKLFGFVDVSGCI